MKITILGANGKIARIVEEMLIEQKNIDMILYLRNAERLNKLKSRNISLVEGDVTDTEKLKKAIRNSDIIYANLAGENIEEQAKSVVSAMHSENKTRLIWVSSLGIYDEVPGKFGIWNNETLGNYLTTYRLAADVIENSDLNYTIIRPAWLTNNDEVEYEITRKNEPFKGTEVSRKSIAELITKIAVLPELYVRDSIGVNKPNTDGIKPAWL